MNFSRGQLILLSCLVASAILTAAITSALARAPGRGSIIRDQGPEHHKGKSKIPGTGGNAFLASILIVGFPGAMLMSDPRAIVGVAGGFLTGLIGLADDRFKILKGDSSGLKARYKLPLQIFVGLFVCGVTYYLIDDTTIRIPFVHDAVNLGIWKIALGLFVFLTIINGVNFTDGLDGLAAGTVMVAAMALGGILWKSGAGTAVIPVVLIGICAGFLPYNWNPAKIFMGDSGALCLAGTLAAAAIATGFELAILIAGIVFIIEITSVVLQVVYFRLTGGKRIFRMTPIHHAWELRGYSEPAIVAGAIVIGAVGGIIAWASV